MVRNLIRLIMLVSILMKYPNLSIYTPKYTKHSVQVKTRRVTVVSTHQWQIFSLSIKLVLESYCWIYENGKLLFPLLLLVVLCQIGVLYSRSRNVCNSWGLPSLQTDPSCWPGDEGGMMLIIYIVHMLVSQTPVILGYPVTFEYWRNKLVVNRS
mgnify:CR=1 FL=1